MIGRRSLLALVGAAPLAAKTGAKELSALVGAKWPSVQGPPNYPPPISGVGSLVYDSKPVDPILVALRNELSAAIDQVEHEEHWKSQFRVDGIEHDINVLKSTSKAYKQLKQYERHMEMSSLLKLAHRKLNW